MFVDLLLSDNQGAICVAHETASRSRAKHIDLKVHFVREQTPSGKMTFKFFPTTVIVADVPTKGLPRVRLAQICKLLYGSAFSGGELKYSSVIGQYSDMVV